MLLWTFNEIFYILGLVQHAKSGQFIYTNTWRGYAGFTDKILYNWKVSGKHEELLDSGQYILKNTSATTCNITQW